MDAARIALMAVGGALCVGGLIVLFVITFKDPEE